MLQPYNCNTVDILNGWEDVFYSHNNPQGVIRQSVACIPNEFKLIVDNYPFVGVLNSRIHDNHQEGRLKQPDL